MMHLVKGAWVTKFCAVVPNICGSSVWNLLYVTLLPPRILRWLIIFGKSVHHCIQ